MYPSRVVDLRPRAGVRETREQPDPEQLVLIGWRSLLGKGVVGDCRQRTRQRLELRDQRRSGAVAVAAGLRSLRTGFRDFPAARVRPHGTVHRPNAGLRRRHLQGAVACIPRSPSTGTLGVYCRRKPDSVCGGDRGHARRHSVLANALAALAFASPLILLHWLLRQACYMRLDARQAACAGASYMMCVVLGTYFLHHRSWLSPATGISLMGLASLVSALGMFISLGMRRPHSREPQLFHDVVADHWCYGRWSLGTYALSWIKEGIYYLLLPGWGGLGAAAALKALVNVTHADHAHVWGSFMRAGPGAGWSAEGASRSAESPGQRSV